MLLKELWWKSHDDGNQICETAERDENLEIRSWETEKDSFRAGQSIHKTNLTFQFTVPIPDACNDCRLGRMAALSHRNCSEVTVSQPPPIRARPFLCWSKEPTFGLFNVLESRKSFAETRELAKEQLREVKRSSGHTSGMM